MAHQAKLSLGIPTTNTSVQATLLPIQLPTDVYGKHKVMAPLVKCAIMRVPATHMG